MPPRSGERPGPAAPSSPRPVPPEPQPPGSKAEQAYSSTRSSFAVSNDSEASRHEKEAPATGPPSREHGLGALTSKSSAFYRQITGRPTPDLVDNLERSRTGGRADARTRTGDPFITSV